jgi:hypothetical protein
MEQLAPRHQTLKRHEAFSWAPSSTGVCDDVSPYDVWRFPFGPLLLLPCIGRDRRVFAAAAPLIIVFMQPLVPKRAGQRPAAGAFMYDTYIIETRKGAAGIVVRDGSGFRFFAASHAFNGLEGQFFGTAKEAEAAAQRHLDGAGARSRTPRQADLPTQWSS